MGKARQAELFQTVLPGAYHELGEAQRVDWLRLSRTPRIGPVTFRDLLNHFGSAGQAIEALEAGRFGQRRFQVVAVDEARFELEQVRKFGAQIVALGEAGYPRWLQAVDNAPPLLYVKGELGLAQRPAVAVVGSRNASATGMKFAGRLAQELGEAGLLVASGLARGIDAAVHQGAVASGTAAVLGGGLDHIYPRQNEALYHQIATEGLLISERPLGFYAKGPDFPRRNRLISGLSLGTVVVEAALRSGSLSTARYAGEQGRDVLAVPGHPLDPRAAGTNRLLKQGAGLVTSAADVLELIGHQISLAENESSTAKSNGFDESDAPCPAPEADGMPATEERDTAERDTAALRAELMNVLGPVPIERDSLTRLLKCSARQLQILLLELDLEGVIDHHGGQQVSLKV